jgi:hypothetical protein
MSRYFEIIVLDFIIIGTNKIQNGCSNKGYFSMKYIVLSHFWHYAVYKAYPKKKWTEAYHSL